MERMTSGAIQKGVPIIVLFSKVCVANCSRSIGSTLARQSSITDDLTMGILCPLFVSQPVSQSYSPLVVVLQIQNRQKRKKNGLCGCPLILYSSSAWQ